MTEKDNKRLTPKQETFCQELARSKDGNLTEAYKKAYNVRNMSSKTIYECASRLANDRKITARLQELAKEIASKYILTREEAQKILTKIARGETTEEELVNDGLDYVKVDVKTQTKEQIKAIEALAKMQGWNDIKIKIDNTPVIKDDI